jgi:hypothetical protein
MKRTVIVIGAGAGKDFGMPTGEELVGQIANRARLKEIFVEQINHMPSCTGLPTGERVEKEFKPYFDLSELVAYYEPFSIDEFLNSIKQNMVNIKIRDHLTTEKDELIVAGKTLIAMFLLQTEDEKVFEGFSSTCWYRHLRSAIVASGNDEGEMQENLKGNLTIISFNYDRSLDYFLQTRLDTFYSSITVIYPYGKLAGKWRDGGKKNYELLPYGYFKNYKGHDRVERGGVRKEIFLVAQEMAKNLQVIGELKIKSETENLEAYKANLSKIKESKDVPEQEKKGAQTSRDILNAMTNAEKFYFFGFAFHEENCRVIFLRELRRDNQFFYYTNFDGSKRVDVLIADFLRGFSLLEGKTKFTSIRGVYDALRLDFDLKL